MFLMKLQKLVLDLLFPPRCIGCGGSGVAICKRCLSKVDFRLEQECPTCRRANLHGRFCCRGCVWGNFEALLVCTDYKKNSIVRTMITQLKYRFCRDFIPILGEVLKTEYVFLSQALPEMSGAVLVPVPVSRESQKNRGFNQAYELAKYLQLSLKNDRRLGWNFHGLEMVDCLKRVNGKMRQAQLKRNDRLKNLINTVILKPEFTNILRSKLVILIDDVATTGSTINECARVLKNSGAARVWGMVLARGK